MKNENFLFPYKYSKPRLPGIRTGNFYSTFLFFIENNCYGYTKYIFTANPWTIMILILLLRL